MHAHAQVATVSIDGMLRGAAAGLDALAPLHAAQDPVHDALREAVLAVSSLDATLVRDFRAVADGARSQHDETRRAHTNDETHTHYETRRAHTHARMGTARCMLVATRPPPHPWTRACLRVRRAGAQAARPYRRGDRRRRRSVPARAAPGTRRCGPRARPPLFEQPAS